MATRFATIGTNVITKNFLQAGKGCDGFEVGAIYSREKYRAEELAVLSGFAQAKACDSLEGLKENEDVDAVYVASPTFLHASQSIEMLRAGKHVFCEKPAASNYAEWDQMQKEAKKAGKVLMEAMRPLFTPGFHVIQENMQKVGRVRKCFLQYCQYSSRYDRFKNGIIENAFRPELSNGSLMDIGIYCVEVMVALFGTPEKILASSVMLPDSIDGEGSAIAQYADMQVILSYSKIADSKTYGEIQGEEGTIYWKDMGAPKQVRFCPRKGEEELLYEQEERMNMEYEIEKYMNLLFDSNLVESYNWITGESLKITDEIRRQSGICFPADHI
ncbi:MAG: Gfo/Idh/MocA family protein [Lachnospiraceae bacterium]